MRWLWYRFVYRAFMRFAHRHNWHHTVTLESIQPGDYTQVWCQWCGLRETTQRRHTFIDKGGVKYEVLDKPAAPEAGSK